MTAKKTAPQPPSIEVTYRQLADAVALVRPHVGTDDTLPMLTGIRFETEDGALTLAGTDRYSLGIARIEQDPKHELLPFGEFAALIPLKELTRVLGIFKPAGRGGHLSGAALRITVDGDRAVFEMASRWSDLYGSRLSVPLIDANFPPFRAILEPLVKNLSEATERVPFTAINPRMHTRFDVVGKVSPGTPLVIRHLAPNKAVLVTARDAGHVDFVGVVMPVRLNESEHSLSWLQERYPTVKPEPVEPPKTPAKRAPRKAPAVKAPARKPRAKKATAA